MKPDDVKFLWSEKTYLLHAENEATIRAKSKCVIIHGIIKPNEVTDILRNKRAKN